jgi:hypothetical protein
MSCLRAAWLSKEAAGEGIMESKRKFLNAKRIDLSNLDAEMGELIKIADTADPVTKALCRNEIDSLLTRSERSHDAMRRLRLAGRVTWKECAADVDEALRDFESAIRDAKSRINSARAR